MRAISLRASLGVRSPAARVRVTTKKQMAPTSATREIISTVRLDMIDTPETPIVACASCAWIKGQTPLPPRSKLAMAESFAHQHTQHCLQLGCGKGLGKKNVCSGRETVR